MLGAGLLAAAAIYWRTAIAWFAITKTVERTGVPVRHVDIGFVDLTKLVLRDVALGDDEGPSARLVEISWTPRLLAVGRVGTILVHEPHMGLTYGEGRYSVDGVAIQPSKSAGSMPFDRLEIERATITVKTPWGHGRLAGGAHIVSGPEGMAPARIDVVSADLDFAGGVVSLSNLGFVPGQPVDTEIAVNRVDLDALLALVDVDGLSGTGSLSGTVPVHVDAEGVRVADGRLAAIGPGRISYAGSALPQDIPGLDKDAAGSVALARQALADFRYRTLSLELARSADGEGDLIARIEGSNPKVLDDQPFALNIRLQANVDTLAEILLDGYATAGQLLQKASVR